MESLLSQKGLQLGFWTVQLRKPKKPCLACIQTWEEGCSPEEARQPGLVPGTWKRHSNGARGEGAYLNLLVRAVRRWRGGHQFHLLPQYKAPSSQGRRDFQRCMEHGCGDVCLQLISKVQPLTSWLWSWEADAFQGLSKVAMSILCRTHLCDRPPPARHPSISTQKK